MAEKLGSGSPIKPEAVLNELLGRIKGTGQPATITQVIDVIIRVKDAKKQKNFFEDLAKSADMTVEQVESLNKLLTGLGAGLKSDVKLQKLLDLGSPENIRYEINDAIQVLKSNSDKQDIADAKEILPKLLHALASQNNGLINYGDFKDPDTLKKYIKEANFAEGLNATDQGLNKKMIEYYKKPYQGLVESLTYNTQDVVKRALQMLYTYLEEADMYSEDLIKNDLIDKDIKIFVEQQKEALDGGSYSKLASSITSSKNQTKPLPKSKKEKSLEITSSQLPELTEEVKQQRENYLRSYLLSEEDFVKKIKTLIAKNFELQESLNDESLSDAEYTSISNQLDENRAEIFKTIAGQKALGRGDKVDNIIFHNIDREKYSEFYNNGVSIHSPTDLAEFSYINNRRNGYLRSKNWQEQQFADMYDIENFGKNVPSAAEQRRANEIGLSSARLLSKIPNLDQVIKKIIDIDTEGNEKGFYIKANGDFSDILEGGEKSSHVHEKGALFTLHTHPNNNDGSSGMAIPSTTKTTGSKARHSDIDTWRRYANEDWKEERNTAIHAIVTKDNVSFLDLNAIPKNIRGSVISDLDQIKYKKKEYSSYDEAKNELQNSIKDVLLKYGIENMDEIFHIFDKQEFAQYSAAMVQEAVSQNQGILNHKENNELKEKERESKKKERDSNALDIQEETQAREELLRVKKEENNIQPPSTEDESQTENIREEVQAREENIDKIHEELDAERQLADALRETEDETTKAVENQYGESIKSAPPVEKFDLFGMLTQESERETERKKVSQKVQKILDEHQYSQLDPDKLFENFFGPDPYDGDPDELITKYLDQMQKVAEEKEWRQEELRKKLEAIYKEDVENDSSPFMDDRFIETAANVQYYDDALNLLEQQVTEFRERSRRQISDRLQSILDEDTDDLSSYFKSPEASEERLRQRWNGLLNKKQLLSDWDNGNISEEDFLRSGKVSNLLKQANAFEALGGSIGDISPEMDEFISKIRQIYDSLDSSVQEEFPQTVEAFEKMFASLKEFPTEILQENGFENLTDDIGSVKTEVLSLEEVLNDIRSKESFTSDFDNINSPQTEEEYKIIAKTREELQKLADEKRQLRAEADNKDYQDYWDIDDWNDIKKISEELQSVKQERDAALDNMDWYYQHAAASSNEGNEDQAKDYLGWYEHYLNDYQQYANQYEHLQEHLNDLTMDFDPSQMTGDYAEAFGVLITLVQNLVTELQALKNLDAFSSFEEFKTSISTISTTLETLSHLDFASSFTELSDVLEKIKVGIDYLASTDPLGSFNTIKNSLSEIRDLANSIKNMDFTKPFTDVNTILNTINESIKQIGNFNFNIALGKSNNPIKQSREEGQVKRSFIPQIQEASDALMKMLYKPGTDSFKESIGANGGSDLQVQLAWKGYEGYDQKNLTSTIQYYKEVISLMKEMAKVGNIDISSWETQFGGIFDNYETALKQIDTQSITEIDDQMNILRDIFSGSQLNVQELSASFGEITKIIAPLTEVTTELKRLIDTTGKSIDFSGEATQVGNLLDAVIKVTTAVDEKTKAFQAENSTVEQVIYNEVVFIEQLREELKAVSELAVTLGQSFNILNTTDFSSISKNIDLQNQIKPLTDTVEKIKTVIPSLNEAIAQIRNTTETTGQSLDFTKETNELQKLGQAIEHVNTAIQNKTQAFKDENTTVEGVIWNEVEFIEQLREELEYISELVKQLNKGFETLNQTDFSSIAKSLELQKQTDQEKEEKTNEEKNAKKSKTEKDKKADLDEEERLSEETHKALLKAISEDEKYFNDYNRRNQHYSQDEFGNMSRYSVDYEETDENGIKKKWRTNYKYDPESKTVKKTVETGMEENVAKAFDTVKGLLDKRYKLLETDVTNPAKDNVTATQRTQSLVDIDNQLNEKIALLTDEERQSYENIRQKKEENLKQLEEAKKLDDREAHFAQHKKDVAKKKADEQKQQAKEEKELNKEIEKEERENERKRKKSERESQKQKKQALDASYTTEEGLIKNIGSLGKDAFDSGTKEVFDTAYSQIVNKLQERTKLLADRTDTDPKSDAKVKKALDDASQNLTKSAMSTLDKAVKKRDSFQEFADQERAVDTTAYKKQLEEYNKTIDSLQAKLKNGLDITNESDIKEIGELIVKVNDLQKALGNTDNIQVLDKNVSNLKKRIATLIEKNPAMGGEIRNQLKEISDGLQNVNQQSLNNAIDQVNRLETTMREAGKTGDTFATKLTKKFRDFGAYLLSYVSFQDFIRYAREGFDIIHQLDDALTEMAKVSDEPLSRLRDFQKESYDMANSVGTTGLTIQQSTADWMRLGETLDDAKESAKDAAILFNVSEFGSIDEATESLVAMSAAYDDLDKLDIIDKLNNVGNNFSISTDGLATALQLSASSLKTAGKKKCLIA